MQKLKYYGFMVELLTGETEILKVVETFEAKPRTEFAGNFCYAKWFLDEQKMIECFNYTNNKIKEIQDARGKLNRTAIEN